MTEILSKEEIDCLLSGMCGEPEKCKHGKPKFCCLECIAESKVTHPSVWTGPMTDTPTPEFIENCRECEHGRMKRKCEICSLTEELSAMTAERDALREKRLNDILVHLAETKDVEDKNARLYGIACDQKNDISDLRSQLQTAQSERDNAIERLAANSGWSENEKVAELEEKLKTALEETEHHKAMNGTIGEQYHRDGLAMMNEEIALAVKTTRAEALGQAMIVVGTAKPIRGESFFQTLIRLTEALRARAEEERRK